MVVRNFFSGNFVLFLIVIIIIFLFLRLFLFAGIIVVTYFAISIGLASNPGTEKIVLKSKLMGQKKNIQEKYESLIKKKELLCSDLKNAEKELRTQAGYISYVLCARVQCTKLETNLVYLVLEEFNKIEARLSLGISYSEISGFFTNAKFAVSQFRISPDYKTCPLLSKNIEEAMLLYEYSIEAMRNKAYAQADSWSTSASTTKLKEILKNDFGVNVGLDRGDIIQTFWRLASERVTQIQQILDKGDYMQFLNSRLNLGKS